MKFLCHMDQIVKEQERPQMGLGNLERASNSYHES